MLIKYTCDSKSQTLRMRSPFQTDRFHTETRGRVVFTWYPFEISHESEILAPVQEPGWTHAGVTRAGVTFWGGIM